MRLSACCLLVLAPSVAGEIAALPCAFVPGETSLLGQVVLKTDGGAYVADPTCMSLAFVREPELQVQVGDRVSLTGAGPLRHVGGRLELPGAASVTTHDDSTLSYPTGPGATDKATDCPDIAGVWTPARATNSVVLVDASGNQEVVDDEVGTFTIDSVRKPEHIGYVCFFRFNLTWASGHSRGHDGEELGVGLVRADGSVLRNVVVQGAGSGEVWPYDSGGLSTKYEGELALGALYLEGMGLQDDGRAFAFSTPLVRAAAPGLTHATQQCVDATGSWATDGSVLVATTGGKYADHGKTHEFTETSGPVTLQLSLQSDLEGCLYTGALALDGVNYPLVGTMHARGSTILMTLVDQNRGAFAAEPAAHTIASNSLVRIEIADDDTGLFVGLLDLEDGAKARALAAWFRPSGSEPLPAEMSAARSCENMRLFEGHWLVGPEQVAEYVYTDPWGRERQKDEDNSADADYLDGSKTKGMSFQSQRGCLFVGVKHSHAHHWDQPEALDLSFESQIGFVQPRSVGGVAFSLDVGANAAEEDAQDIEYHTSPSRRRWDPVDDGSGKLQLLMSYAGEATGGDERRNIRYSSVGAYFYDIPKDGCRRPHLPSPGSVLQQAALAGCAAGGQPGATAPFQWHDLAIIAVGYPSSITLSDASGREAVADIPCMQVGVCSGYPGRLPRVGDTVASIEGLLVPNAATGQLEFVVDEAVPIVGWVGESVDSAEACEKLRLHYSRFGAAPPQATLEDLSSCLAAPPPPSAPAACDDDGGGQQQLAIGLAAGLGVPLVLLLVVLLFCAVQSRSLTGALVKQVATPQANGYAMAAVTSKTKDAPDHV
jgi:hypothetical protein